MAARLGNDEFAVILEADHAHRIADRLMKELSEPIHIGDKDIRIHASIGIATFPQDGKTNTELIKAADNAMRNVKQRGGGNLCFFDAKQSDHVLENKTRRSKLTVSI